MKKIFKFKKETEEKRNYYKPMRCVGGFILSFTVLSTILVSLSSSLTLVVSQAIESEILSQTIVNLISYSVMIYGYYLGYRIFFKKYQDKIWDKKMPCKKDILLIVILIIVGFFAVRGIWYLYDQACWYIGGIDLDGEGSQTFLDIGTMIYVCLLAPIAEELVFRGWIINILKRYGKYFAIIVSSILFGLFHGTFSQAIPAIFIGLLLDYMALRFDSIIPGIVLHILNNVFSTVDSYFVLINLPTTLLVVCTAIIFISILLWNIKKIPIKSLGKRLQLVWHSRACMVFFVVYIVIIVIDMLSYL